LPEQPKHIFKWNEIINNVEYRANNVSEKKTGAWKANRFRWMQGNDNTCISPGPLAVLLVYSIFTHSDVVW